MGRNRHGDHSGEAGAHPNRGGNLCSLRSQSGSLQAPSTDQIRRCPAAQCHRQGPQADLAQEFRFAENDRYQPSRVVTRPTPQKISNQEEVFVVKNKKRSLLASGLLSVATAAALTVLATQGA